MSLSLKVLAIVFIIIVLITINLLAVKDRISVKYSLVWNIPCILLILFILIPGLLVWFTDFFGFQTASNMVLSGLFALLLFISISLTVIVSKQSKQIRVLTQEVSLLKSEIKTSNNN